MEKTQSRFKSWALWLAVASLAVMVIKEFAGIDLSETLDKVLDAALPVLVGFGVINNPTSSKTM